MYYVYFLFLSLVVSEVNSETIEDITESYFKNESVREFRKTWDLHRKPLEHAIISAVKETVGLIGMNVYIRKRNEKLASGYFHNDNQVCLILKNLDLDSLPRFFMPDVQFSLASNVLKIQTLLSKMIIHAEYGIVRNESDIIYEPKDQDPYKASPFLFQQVQDIGRIAISLEGCALSGLIMATLNGESINLGYNNFRVTHCQYTIEIYRPGEVSPPVIAKYSPYRTNNGLSLTDLLMKPINDELVPKLQGAMFSFVNTSAIFSGTSLQEYRVKQAAVFEATSQYLTDAIRSLNVLTITLNNGAIDMDTFSLQWYDGRNKGNTTESKAPGRTLMLTGMVLTGLDTAYSAHIGGPCMLNSIMIAEEIRFSSLQIRGLLEIESLWSGKYSFSAEISDLAVDLLLAKIPPNAYEEASGEKQSKKNKKKQSKRSEERTKYTVKKIEVTGFRRMSLMVPSIKFGSVESLLDGYLLSEVPKVIKAHLEETLPNALKNQQNKPPEENNIEPEGDDNPKESPEEIGSDDSKPVTNETQTSKRGPNSADKKVLRGRAHNLAKLKTKHRTKGAADNEIRKK